MPTAGATSGVDYLVKVKVGGSFVTVGAGRDATLQRGTSNADATNKDSGGIEEHVITRRNWSMQHDGLLIEDDAAYDELCSAWRNNEFVEVQFAYPSGGLETGFASIEDLSAKGPENDVATVSISLKGNGELTASGGAES